ncbi:MAG: hypothetical protein HY094_02490 [Candidatus Melainabacteria bacterium]|nr:hypothetical protein [Candidatus Melainabacteria bacterium]
MKSSTTYIVALIVILITNIFQLIFFSNLTAYSYDKDLFFINVHLPQIPDRPSLNRLKVIYENVPIFETIQNIGMSNQSSYTDPYYEYEFHRPLKRKVVQLLAKIREEKK